MLFGARWCNAFCIITRWRLTSSSPSFPRLFLSLSISLSPRRKWRTRVQMLPQQLTLNHIRRTHMAGVSWGLGANAIPFRLHRGATRAGSLICPTRNHRGFFLVGGQGDRTKGKASFKEGGKFGAWSLRPCVQRVHVDANDWLIKTYDDC